MHEPATENREERLAALEERVLQLEQCVAESRPRRVIPYYLRADRSDCLGGREPVVNVSRSSGMRT